MSRTILVNLLALAGSLVLWLVPSITTEQWAAVSGIVIAIINLFLPPLVGGKPAGSDDGGAAS